MPGSRRPAPSADSCPFRQAEPQARQRRWARPEPGAPRNCVGARSLPLVELIPLPNGVAVSERPRIRLPVVAARGRRVGYVDGSGDWRRHNGSACPHSGRSDPASAGEVPPDRGLQRPNERRPVRLRLVGYGGRLRHPQACRRRRKPLLTEPRGIEPPSPKRPLATYEDLAYRDVFWAAAGTRTPATGSPSGPAAAVRRSPDRGRGGFGRLADEYHGYGEVVLLDSSEVHVAAAGEAFAGDKRIEVVLGDARALPYPDGHFDAAVCVRVLPPLRRPRAGAGRARPGHPAGRSRRPRIRNKRNLKSIARRVLGRQSWSPFELGSVDYKPFHFDTRRSASDAPCAGPAFGSSRCEPFSLPPATLTRRLPLSLRCS